MRDRIHEINSLRRDLHQLRRVIGAKQFAIELLAQESLYHKAQQLISSEAFRRNALLFGSLHSHREGVATEASSPRKVEEPKSDE